MSRSFGGVDAPRLGAAQLVALATSATSAASTAFAAQTYAIRIASTVAAGVFYRIGDPAATPTAVTTDTFLPANWVEYVRVTPGQKLAAITATGTGNVSLTELTQ